VAGVHRGTVTARGATGLLLADREVVAAERAAY
jgi:hypothetical protein